MPRYILIYGKQSFGRVIPDKVILVDADSDEEAEEIARQEVRFATPVIIVAKVISCYKLELEQVMEIDDVRIYSGRNYHRVDH